MATACEYGTDYLQYLQDFSGRHAFDLIYCPLKSQLGAQELALFVFGGLALMFAIRDSKPIVPLTFAILFGGVAITRMPPVVARIAIILFSLGVPIGVLYLYHRAKPRR